MVSPVATAQQIAATSQTRRRPRLQFMKPHTKEGNYIPDLGCSATYTFPSDRLTRFNG